MQPHKSQKKYTIIIGIKKDRLLMTDLFVDNIIKY